MNNCGVFQFLELKKNRTANRLFFVSFKFLNLKIPPLFIIQSLFAVAAAAHPQIGKGAVLQQPQNRGTRPLVITIHT